MSAGARLATRYPNVVALAGLLGVAVLAFGPYLTQLGFYWDDWPLAWVIRSDTYSIGDYFASDRPLQGLLYSAATSVIPADPLPWHAALLALSWACAGVVWWVVRLTWPGHNRVAFMVACLFLVYPGFTQQPIALIYSLSHYLPLLGFLVSLAASVQSVRQPHSRSPLTVVGLVGLAVSLTTEYFLALEALRAVLLYVVAIQVAVGREDRLRLVARAWAPYLLLVGSFAVWRFFIFEPDREEVGLIALDNLRSEPLTELTSMPRRVVSDVFETGVLAWAQPFQERALDFSYGRVVAVSTVLGGMAGLLAAGSAEVLRRAKARAADLASHTHLTDGSVTRGLLTVGAVGVVAGGVPAWVAARQVVLSTGSDRYALPAVLGASVLLVGLLRALKLSTRATAATFAVLVALATSFHIQNASTYAADWDSQRSLFSQLSWYAPEFERGTTVVLEEAQLEAGSDYALSAAVADVSGAVLGPDGTVPFWVFTPEDLAEEEVSDGTWDLDREIRGLQHAGVPDLSVVAVKPAVGCLRILDPMRPELWVGSPVAQSMALRSTPSRVAVATAPDGADPTLEPEPPSGWCYQFQRLTAALAREDLEAALAAVDRIEAQELTPMASDEWVPVAEALLLAGRESEALSVLDLALEDPSAAVAVCGFIDRQVKAGVMTEGSAVSMCG